MSTESGPWVIARSLVFIALSAVVCAVKQDALAQVVGPFPIASQFSYPISEMWNCDPDNLSADTTNCAQHVGDYYSIPDDSLSPTGRVHSLCGKHLADDIAVGQGTLVTAVADGIVRRSEPRETLGYVVNIEHKLPDGSFVTSVYMHMKRRGALSAAQAAQLPVVGSLIHRGDFVGVVTDVAADNFGHEHLHFGLRRETVGGYKGRVTRDPRTNYYYYVGYSSHFYSDGSRRCDDAGAGGIVADRLNPTHDAVVADWVRKPRAFITEKLAPAPLSNLIRGSFSGIVTTTYVSHDGTTMVYNQGTPVGVNQGDRISGYFQYDVTQTTDDFPSDPTIGRYPFTPVGQTQFYIEVNGKRWASGNSMNITVESNRFFSYQGVYQSQFVLQFLDAGSSFPGNQVAGEGAVSIQIATWGATPNGLLSSDRIPTSLSDLSLNFASTVAVYVLSDYPTYPPGRYGFFTSIDLSTLQIQ